VHGKAPAAVGMGVCTPTDERKSAKPILPIKVPGTFIGARTETGLALTTCSPRSGNESRQSDASYFELGDTFEILDVSSEEGCTYCKSCGSNHTVDKRCVIRTA